MLYISGISDSLPDVSRIESVHKDGKKNPLNFLIMI